MKRFIVFICVIFMSLNISAGAVPKPPGTNASGAALIDFNSGAFLYKKNVHNKYAPASTTKIMTALLTLEKCKLTDKVVIGKNPPYEDGSKIYLLEGEEVTVEQLLYALMLESANDSALALAEHISGSKEAFAKLMNEKAALLGCTETNFVNPNGLYKKDHYTSAHDLGLITIKAMENPIFRKIIATVSYNMLPTNKQPQTRYFHNHNKLLSIKSVKYKGADGVKTGYTIKSKHTYVGSATRNGRTLIAVFLHDDATFYKETASLFNYGFNNFVEKKVYSKETASSLKLKDDNSEIPVYPERDVFVTIPKGTNPSIKTDIVINNTLSKVTRGEIVGTINVLYDGKVNTSVNLISSRDYSVAKAFMPSADNSVKSIFKLSSLKYLLLLVILAFLCRGFYRKYKRLSRLG